MNTFTLICTINYRFIRGNYSITDTTAGGKLSFSLNSILLSCDDSVRRGGDLDDSRSELVIARLHSLMRTGATLVSWIPVVWRERTRSWDWSRAGFRHRLRPCVRLYRDQLPNPTRVGVVVVHELYLGCTYSSVTYECCNRMATDWRAIFVTPVIFELPGDVDCSPVKAGIT